MEPKCYRQKLLQGIQTDSMCNRVTKTKKKYSLEVIRRPYTNKSDESLKKVVVCISNGHFPLVFIKYQLSRKNRKRSNQSKELFSMFMSHWVVWKNRNPLVPFQGEEIKHFTSEESSLLLMMILSTTSRRQWPIMQKVVKRDTSVRTLMMKGCPK